MRAIEKDDGRPYDIQWSDKARVDLREIGDYIATDTPTAAERWIDRLIGDVERAARMPFAGRLVPEFAEHGNIREVFRRTYRIVYSIGDDTIEVLTIFEGHRLFPADVTPQDSSK